MIFALASQFHVYLFCFRLAQCPNSKSASRGLLRDCEIFANLRLKLYCSVLAVLLHCSHTSASYQPQTPSASGYYSAAVSVWGRQFVRKEKNYQSSSNFDIDTEIDTQNIWRFLLIVFILHIGIEMLVCKTLPGRQVSPNVANSSK